MNQRLLVEKKFLREVLSRRPLTMALSEIGWSVGYLLAKGDQISEKLRASLKREPTLAEVADHILDLGK